MRGSGDNGLKWQMAVLTLTPLLRAWSFVLLVAWSHNVLLVTVMNQMKIASVALRERATPCRRVIQSVRRKPHKLFCHELYEVRAVARLWY